MFSQQRSKSCSVQVLTVSTAHEDEDTVQMISLFESAKYVYLHQSWRFHLLLLKKKISLKGTNCAITEYLKNDSCFWLAFKEEVKSFFVLCVKCVWEKK